MQYVLDKDILEYKRIEKYPLEEMRISLFIGLGEIIRNLPIYFEFWNDKTLDNRGEALSKYVDCLAFKMSIFNYQMQYKDKNSIPLPKYEDCELGRCDLSPLLIDGILWDNFYYLFAIGNRLGFTWNEIYRKYKYKHEVAYNASKKY